MDIVLGSKYIWLNIHDKVIYCSTARYSLNAKGIVSKTKVYFTENIYENGRKDILHSM